MKFKNQTRAGFCRLCLMHQPLYFLESHLRNFTDATYETITPIVKQGVVKKYAGTPRECAKNFARAKKRTQKRTIIKAVALTALKTRQKLASILHVLFCGFLRILIGGAFFGNRTSPLHSCIIKIQKDIPIICRRTRLFRMQFPAPCSCL